MVTTDQSYDAFLSYAHVDNDRQGGRITLLVEAIADEYSITSGQDLNLFIDREAIQWGDLWRDKIEHALGQAPFLIAIITPKYLKSVECRRELLSFVAATSSRQMGKLFLPILFIDVDDLTENSEDEVRAIIARTQYIDWRELRLKDQSDPMVLAKINSIAGRMRQLQAEVDQASRRLELKSDAEAYDSIMDVVSVIDSKLDSWMESVEFDRVAGKVWSTTVNERVERIQRLQLGGRRGGPVLAVLKKLGADLLPIAIDRFEKARTFARLTIELDPLVTAAIAYVSENPEFEEILSNLRDGVQEAMLNINPAADIDTWQFPPDATKYSRSMKEATAKIKESMAYVIEGDEIVEQWSEKLENLATFSQVKKERVAAVLDEIQTAVVPNPKKEAP